MAIRCGLRSLAKAPILALCVVLLLALGVQVLASVCTTSPTFDEPYHIVRSYVYLKTGDSALLARGGHPPFTNMLSAVPLLLRSDIVLPPHEPGWQDVRGFKDLFRVADDFFWRMGNDAQGIALWSRLPVLFLSLLLAWLVFLWAKQRNGMMAGLLALLLYAFDPNIIAHSGVVTTDLGATLLVFASVYSLWRFCQRPSWRRLSLTGIVFGLAQASKFSALFLGPIVLALLGIWAFGARGPLFSSQVRGGPSFAVPGQSRFSNRPRLQRVYVVLGICLVIFLIGFLVLWGVYGFQVRPLLPHESSHPLLDRWIPAQDASLRRTAYALAETAPIPAPAYFAELAWLYNYSRAGHPSFLLGQYSRSGWWYYFPVAFAIKTPIPTLVLLIAAAYLSFRRRDVLWDEYFLLVPMALFFAGSIFSSVDIGYRDILPVLPLAFVYVSKLATRLSGRWIRLALVGLCVWYVMGTLALSPHYLAYFNEVVGGPDKGYKYLVDSNLDWGQDLKGLKQYMDAHSVPWVYLSYFGTADPAYYGIRHQAVPDHPPAPDTAPAYYAVSATSLQEVYAQGGSISWLTEYQPEDKVGYSIFIYRLP